MKICSRSSSSSSSSSSSNSSSGGGGGGGGGGSSISSSGSSVCSSSSIDSSGSDSSSSSGSSSDISSIGSSGSGSSSSGGGGGSRGSSSSISGGIPVATFTHDINNHVPHTSTVPTVYSVAAVLYLQSVLHEMLFRPYNVFCISTSRSLCAVHNKAVVCSSLISRFAGILLRYYLK